MLPRDCTCSCWRGVLFVMVCQSLAKESALIFAVGGKSKSVIGWMVNVGFNIAMLSMSSL